VKESWDPIVENACVEQTREVDASLSLGVKDPKLAPVDEGEEALVWTGTEILVDPKRLSGSSEDEWHGAIAVNVAMASNGKVNEAITIGVVERETSRDPSPVEAGVLEQE